MSGNRAEGVLDCEVHQDVRRHHFSFGRTGRLPKTSCGVDNLSTSRDWANSLVTEFSSSGDRRLSCARSLRLCRFKRAQVDARLDPSRTHNRYVAVLMLPMEPESIHQEHLLGQLCTACDTELLIHLAQVIVHGSRADEQLGSYFAVGIALGNQPCDS